MFVFLPFCDLSTLFDRVTHPIPHIYIYIKWKIQTELQICHSMYRAECFGMCNIVDE